MLKILQGRLQQYMNQELPDIQAGFRKGRGSRDHIVNIHWIIKKAREFPQKIYFCFIDYAKSFDCVDHNKLENSKRWVYPILGISYKWNCTMSGFLRLAFFTWCNVFKAHHPRYNR